MLATRGFTPAVACFGLLLVAVGCRGRDSAGDGRDASEPPPLSRDDQAVYQSLEAEINKIVSDETIRYSSLEYKYNENLLEILDQVERSLDGKVGGEPPRFLPKLSAEEERDHFRETVRRWEAQTGKRLRAEVEPLKAEVAARMPGEAFHPDFQRRFSKAIDQFIPIEVAEMRERRNRAIHAAAETALAPARSSHPEAVRRIEALLNEPPYRLPSTGGAKPPAVGPAK